MDYLRFVSTIVAKGKGSAGMSHKIYRLCLLSVVMIAIVTGIFYYLECVQKEAEITEGTFVKHLEWENLCFTQEMSEKFLNIGNSTEI